MRTTVRTRRSHNLSYGTWRAASAPGMVAHGADAGGARADRKAVREAAEARVAVLRGALAADPIALGAVP